MHPSILCMVAEKGRESGIQLRSGRKMLFKNGAFPLVLCNLKGKAKLQ